MYESSDFPSLESLRNAYADESITPVEVAENYLSRIAKADPLWGPIFLDVTVRRALAEAEQATKRYSGGQSRGPCDGIPMAWKDVFDIAGLPTMVGTKFLPSSPARSDAAIVAALADAGAVCLGKTQCSELSFSVLGENEVLGTPLNPFGGGTRLPGGSSSGAAVAVARGLALLAIGTDNGGSVRLPAAWCGLVGFVPTRESVVRHGIVPFSPSLDSVGFIANKVEDVRLLFESCAVDWRSGATTTGSPVLLVPKFGKVAAISAEVLEEFCRTVERLKSAGFRVEDIDYSIIDDVHRFRERSGSLAMLEGVELWQKSVLDAGDLASARLRNHFETYDETARPCRARLIAGIRDLTASFCAAMGTNSYLLLPASPITSPEVHLCEGSREIYESTYALAHAFLWPFNLLNAPSITLPTGACHHGMPIGILVVAPRPRDTSLLRLAAAIERTIGVRPQPRSS